MEKKIAHVVRNTLVGITSAQWVNQYQKGNQPSHQGSLVLSFSDGSEIRVPVSAWYNDKPEGKRPNISTVLNTRKFTDQMEQAEELAGDSLFDNPLLRDKKETRDADEFENRDAVHDAETSKKIARKTRAKKVA